MTTDRTAADMIPDPALRRWSLAENPELVRAMSASWYRLRAMADRTPSIGRADLFPMALEAHLSGEDGPAHVYRELNRERYRSKLQQGKPLRAAETAPPEVWILRRVVEGLTPSEARDGASRALSGLRGGRDLFRTAESLFCPLAPCITG